MVDLPIGAEGLCLQSLMGERDGWGEGASKGHEVRGWGHLASGCGRSLAPFSKHSLPRLSAAH